MLIILIVVIIILGSGGGYYGHSRWGYGGGAGTGLGTILLVLPDCLHAWPLPVNAGLTKLNSHLRELSPPAGLNILERDNTCEKSPYCLHYSPAS